ncbi:LamG-like jellyroll fold domain-containing protein [Hyunsoonleella pacifica]|uniref:T9SS type A sorting domain-containing protein n=1 Tax=Hyunsoonleella pacifica TaxID=1080224 RepID=A0A4Q9FIY3_9FLAO|nr:LamG-like jellyroll fold domain-containing protein [Hyunsoonleella pacifica]TBN13099.1 T9SS type A sorting domain-containing protein [Hyunsoonleella pacifica]GGD28099.1 hypothetical protein GCM10011368_32670 [Hyunsoonleella pacifica]
MKHIAITLLIVFSLFFNTLKVFAQLHTTPECGNNYTLNWSTYPEDSNEYGWPSGALSNVLNNVDNSDVDITITFTGETSTLGFWAGQTPKVGTKSSYLHKGIDLLSNGFVKDGITCTITFSKPIYALSFDIHHINVYEVNGDKYTITGKNLEGDIIYPEFTHSPSPSYTTDETTGIVNAVSNLTSGENPIVGVNFTDPNYITSITILWEDCESCAAEKAHATGIGNFSFCTPQTLDFDGEDDYISTPAFLGGHDQITMMSWIKADSNSGSSEIMGQRNFRLYLDNNNKLKTFIKTDTGLEIVSPDITEGFIEPNIWQHVAVVYDGDTGIVLLYLNGNIIWSYSDAVLANTTINNTTDWNTDHDFEIGRNTEIKNNYFEGSINEIRIYKTALNSNQLHQQINQKIKNNNGYVRGTTIPKDIVDLTWDDLILYYKMDILDTGYTLDSSLSNKHGLLHNMSTFQEYTAPLPYITKTNNNNNNWKDANSWLHGNTWNIHNDVPEHAIVSIQSNIETNENLNTIGLIVNQGKNLIINNNSGLFNSWYLKLDGNIKLKDGGQLIQTENSTLDETSSGVLEKDIKGTSDKYTYNYWSSPVSKQSNIKNNTNYTVQDIFYGIEFLTNGYDGSEIPLGIADYWIWKFSNKLSDDYASWQHVRSTGEIAPGEGFTMKGPGTNAIDSKQEYTLKGKPNNGDINLTVNAGNDYLVGNPYPSAIDAVEFLLDNKAEISGLGSTNGSLYFWQHWGGGSHVANDYQGGYATFSLSGSIPAASKGTNTQETETKNTAAEIPGRYIPVGQGFYITSETNGTIKFNNSQRVFYNNDDTNSIKFKNNSANKKIENSIGDSRMKLRIGFYSANTIKRQLLLTEDKNATFGVDWGYDSKYIDTQIDDMYWMLNREKYLIQAIDTITPQTILPIGVHTNKPGLNSISIDKLENPTSEIEIYLHDKELDVYHNLKESKYETYLPEGEVLERFEITFSKSQNILSTEKRENLETMDVYYSNKNNSITINNPNAQNIKLVEMFNILGQSLFNLNVDSNKKLIEYKVPQNISGNYVINIETDLMKITKKILIR